ncbi:hypothetical protein GTQ43_05440 [Nostoc sp. KVJ3]|uniref:hypothetical protein n=1 Tax=Nostoc sp. KVJ3 TaxID=457945 RepID=UPI0022375AE6|nr:hypothetical protein [Nostoc sp. KVJ3]MCW5313270.1 hypothetical protein [Nostoc sp. KVJ3]
MAAGSEGSVTYLVGSQGKRRIVKNGLYLKFNSQIVFFNRLNNVETKGRQSNFNQNNLDVYALMNSLHNYEVKNMIAESTATIYAAIIAAGTEAAHKAADAASSDGAVNMAGVFVNCTPFSWKRKENTGKPSSGAWTISPSEQVLSGQTAKEIKQEHWQESSYTAFSLHSRGLGVEALAVYHCEEKNIDVCFLLDNPKMGRPQAGVSFSQNWLEDQADGEGKEIIDHIHDVRTELCQISEGEQRTVHLDGFKVVFQAADRGTVFKMIYEG